MNDTAEITDIVESQTQRDVAAFELIQRQAKMLAASTLVPKDFVNNVANCAIGLNIAHRLKADAFMVIQNIDIIHGRPSFRATFLIAMVNASGRFSPLRFRIEQGGKRKVTIEYDKWDGPQGARTKRSVKKDIEINDSVCVAWARDLSNQEVIEGPPVSMQLAIDEGWISKDGSKWLTMPELMLRYRAAAFFARLYAPDITLGMQTAEELRDTEIDVTPKQRTVARATPLVAAIDSRPESAAIEAETVPDEGNPVFDDFLLSIGEVNTAADLESYKVQASEFEKEVERTIAKQRVEARAVELGLMWSEKTGGFITQ